MAKAAPNRVKAETLSLRISPNLKFGLELLSRMEERSLTTEVEKALGELFDRTPVDANFLGGTVVGNANNYPEVSFYSVLMLIYTLDAPTRLIRTAILLPRTLTQRDHVILDLVSGNPDFYAKSADYFPSNTMHQDLVRELTEEYLRHENPLDIKALRRNWSKINEVVDFVLEYGHYPDEVEWL